MNAHLAVIGVLLMGALMPNHISNTSDFVVDPRDVVTIVHASDLHYGPAGTQNRDEAPVGLGATDPNVRLVSAIRSIAGNKHPLDGTTIRVPDVEILTGDLVHEGSESTARLMADFPTAYLIDGNHDMNHVRDLIRQRHGSLNWGAKIGRVYVQALTETFSTTASTAPPSVTQINNVTTKLAGRPTTEPIIWLVHRSFNGGYEAEWTAGALDAFEALCNARNTLCILNGHDHETTHGTWRGIRVFSPGSITQSPMVPPYGGSPSYYPESFNVIRVGNGWYDVANYCFGYDTTRVWTPGVWQWAERLAFTI